MADWTCQGCRRSLPPAIAGALLTRDWITLECSALLYTGRLWLKCEEAILDRLLPAGSITQFAST